MAKSTQKSSEAEEPISMRPINENEKLLRTKFYESIVAQSDLMDKLAERLLTLELAIPGVYATALKLIRGDKATVGVDWLLVLVFACWASALAMTLIALMPKDWKVDIRVLKQDPQKFSDEGLGIEDFFNQSARDKRGWLTASSVVFFAGILSAVFTL